MGYVYLLGDMERGCYKIGVTRNKNSSRFRSLQCGNAGTLQIRHLEECPYPFRLESMLHRFYSPKRIKNEWFELSAKEVSNFPNRCHKFIEIIEIMKDNPFFTKGLK